MLVRILSAAVLLPLFLAVIYLCPLWAAGILLCLLCALSAYELLYATGITKNRYLVGVAVLFAAATPWWGYFGYDLTALIGGVGLLLFCLFAYGVFAHERGKSFAPAGADALLCAAFAAFVFPFCFSLLLPLLSEESGKLLFPIPFLASWMSDACAYFGGRAFGRHKLAPTVSPKKTVEGAVCGMVGACAFLALYGWIMTAAFSREVNFAALLVFAFIGAAVGQIGDLSLSLLKRMHGIKDYGNLVPGHGGVLDRFDSVLFILPLFYVMQTLFTIL